MSEWVQMMAATLLSMATAVVAAWLSARWAVQGATREKWWRRKERAYAELVESLHDMIRYCSLMAKEYLEGGEREHPKKKEFREKYSEAYWRIQRATDIGAFVISEDVVAVLKALRERPQLKWEENPPWEIYEADEKYYREALDGIRSAARKDLAV